MSELFGHTNLTTTSRYLNIHRRGLQMAMQTLERQQAEQKAVAQLQVVRKGGLVPGARGAARRGASA